MGSQRVGHDWVTFTFSLSSAGRCSMWKLLRFGNWAKGLWLFLRVSSASYFFLLTLVKQHSCWLPIFCQGTPHSTNHLHLVGQVPWPCPNLVLISALVGLPWSQMVKNPCNARDLGFIRGLGRSPGGRYGNPLQYSRLENPHGQRNLVGYSPQGHKEPDTAEQLGTEHSTALIREKKCIHMCAKLCPTLCDPTDCSPPGSSVHRFLQARILEWVAIPFTGGIFLTQGSNSDLLHWRQILYHLSYQGSPDGFSGKKKNPPSNTGVPRDMGLIPGSGRSSGGGNGNPLQYSSLQNAMNRGAWQITVLGVTWSQTWLKRLSMQA